MPDSYRIFPSRAEASGGGGRRALFLESSPPPWNIRTSSLLAHIPFSPGLSSVRYPWRPMGRRVRDAELRISRSPWAVDSLLLGSKEMFSPVSQALPLTRVLGG